MKLILSFIYAIPITIGAALMIGWWLMILADIIQQEWISSFPTLRYLEP